ncbi:hypothetical protein GMD78_20375 [Ornithinibacillus sp. L9]|uniref:Lipoprotein n=1 Tax=Ornithinibacillus caprae TaxID=2678566 RepID=A0A6N8FML0_9BACI|nr:hypothetical protein [Ornithinibacillus caprae]MUK90715.1 hypothetical protein [Ornithinibacillus caprae]
MLRIFFLLMILPILSGCFFNVERSNENSNEKNMPKDMPTDFNFSLKSGINKNNEINTYENTLTKDLIEDGKVTTTTTFTGEEMLDIYEKMRGINILAEKNLIPVTTCMQEPYEDDEWKITINGETTKLLISGKYCESTEDAKQLIQLRNYIYSKVKRKEEYKNLPKAKGGYE